MAAISLKTAKRIVPMIYAYTTPEIARHNGWIKIGYTEQGVNERIGQQTHTADVMYRVEWKGSAIYDDGSGESFTDKQFQAYLRKLNVENNKRNEWFRISSGESRRRFYEFRSNRGVLELPDIATPYELRDEQQSAVSMTAEYFKSHEKAEFLWNAKPRFGKTLAVYDLCKRLNAQKVLVVTNRPAIANSWYSDYVEFMGRDSGYLFVSHVEALAGKPHVLTHKQFVDKLVADNVTYSRIEFVSLQDLKGSIYFGGEYDKLEEAAGLEWDLLVIDEAHEGVDTYKTDIAFDKINRKFTLHLSGTPFKALANEKFPQDAIFNWTYADEQEKKRNWAGEPGDKNPYANLPKLNLFTYLMSEIIKDELKQGIEIKGETEEYAFDLNLFFETDGNGKFIHESAVDKFLDALTIQEKFPFSTDELRAELKHTFWLLNRVDSAKALAKKLKNHPIFGQYEIILAAGDGKLDDDTETEKSFDKVVKAIAEYEKTITISVGQLTTGVTIPEWSAVLMLSNIKSPALYMQAAFRSQNPCLYRNGNEFYRKENAYVFDFDPARTLIIFEEFANDLSPDTAEGKGDTDKRKANVRNLLNFFPVIGEDENGEMIALDAEKVLSIPRKIKSQEVVKRGFMSDFLFQNISNVFRAPQAILEILQNFTPVQKPKGKLEITAETGEELSLDENGEVSLGDEYVIGRSKEIFGDKIYADTAEIEEVVKSAVSMDPEAPEAPVEKLKAAVSSQIIKPMLDTAKEQYGSEMRQSDRKRIERKLNADAARIIDKANSDYTIARNLIDKNCDDDLKKCTEPEQREQALQKAANEKLEAFEKHKKALSAILNDYAEEVPKEIVKTFDTAKKESEKKGYEDSVRAHLRGFARTVPSFLMAYGGENVTLADFDKIIPDDVFLEVTSITTEQFRFLRDGGSYIDAKTGEEAYFEGRLFDAIVFDDSVREFLSLRRKLANYFDENNKEDIFDYIPPQKTNQIFTPKWVVRKMVDMLEEENPGCFDDPDKTFIDPYMKSGLYIAEIVKRLYRSEKMKRLFPESRERLKHIFTKQVYGLAPTEIIFKIAVNYILGFACETDIESNNFRQIDALKYAREGTLEECIEEAYGEIH